MHNPTNRVSTALTSGRGAKLAKLERDAWIPVISERMVCAVERWEIGVGVLGGVDGGVCAVREGCLGDLFVGGASMAGLVAMF